MARKASAAVALAAAPLPGGTVVTITPPAFKTAVFEIVGTAPLVIHKFSQKTRDGFIEKHKLGSQTVKGKKREPRDFDAQYQQARHLSRDGWDGIPAAAFRIAMIDACRLVGFKMTMAKQALFVEADGFDADEGTPLVKITGGKPRRLDMMARNDDGGADIRVRPQWETWGATVRVKYDSDLFSTQDVTNLLLRAGVQVGVCEGRPYSKKSAGMGWGTWTIKGKEA